MRLAWVGPTPNDTGGAPYVGTQLLKGLAREGVEVDVYLACPESDVSAELFGVPGLRFYCKPTGWAWDRWYSRSPGRAFVSGNLSRMVGQLRLAELMAERHRERRYDLVYQFSQTELSALRRRMPDLPPVVVHPSTHAAGELAWYRREAELSKLCEPQAKRAIVEGMLRTRASVQRRDLARARRVLGVSRIFSDHVARDYGLPADRVGVVPNPIDLKRFHPHGEPRQTRGAVKLLYVSRMSARKGVEMIVGLSHRLADLAGKVEIQAIGGATTWSDYRPLLAELNRDVATFEDSVSPAELSERYRSSHAVIQPSRYEPFGLTIGEGLATGLPVVASDEVGAVDGVSREVCGVFPSGDLDGFEAEVRRLVTRIDAGEGPKLADAARAEAERLFAPSVITSVLVRELDLARA